MGIDKISANSRPTESGERSCVFLVSPSSPIMPNRSRGGFSRAHRLDRGKGQKRTLVSGLQGAQVTSTESTERHSHNKFEHIPSISRSSGVERDGDTYVHILICLIVPGIEAYTD
jgi:hypothetical protein